MASFLKPVTRNFLLFTAGIWIFQATYSLLNAGLYQQFSQTSPNWPFIAIYSYVSAVVWWGLTLIVYQVVYKLQSLKVGLTHHIGIHVVLAILFSALHRLLFIFMSFNLAMWSSVMDPDKLKLEHYLGPSFIYNVLKGAGVYLAIAGILYGYNYYQRSRTYQLQKGQLELELTKVRIQNLKFQFQPHFLFNSLQCISTLMHRDVNSADLALGNLGDLLRHSIRTFDVEKIPLGTELFYLQKYINLQKTRYTYRFRTYINCPDDLLLSQVPTLILQPLVENSLKHGTEKTGLTTSLHITISELEEDLLLICKDDNSITEPVEWKSGTGLNNLKMRLHNIYGESATVSAKAGDTGFEVAIRLPLEIQRV